jgi:hypothetical protein
VGSVEEVGTVKEEGEDRKVRKSQREKKKKWMRKGKVEQEGVKLTEIWTEWEWEIGNNK